MNIYRSSKIFLFHILQSFVKTLCTFSLKVQSTSLGMHNEAFIVL